MEHLKSILKSKYHYSDAVDISCTSNGMGKVYKATLHVSFDMPLLGRVGVYSVKSETRTLQAASACEAHKY